MWNANSGYVGYSRSVRSLEAIEEGKLTFSQLKAWQKRAVKAGAVQPWEWHHTSKFFNKTYYYHPESFEDLDPKDFPPVKKEKKEETKVFYVLVSERWYGSRRYRKFDGYGCELREKITVSQKNAEKYSHEDCGIYEFKTKRSALAFMKKETERLAKIKRRIPTRYDRNYYY